MTHRQPAPTDLESALRGQFRDLDPGPAPLDLRRRVEQVPDTFERLAPPTARRIVGPALGLAAALAILALGVRVLPSSGFRLGPSATVPPAAAFDPSRTGIGLGPEFSAAEPWFFVIFGAIALVVLGLGLRGRRALVPLTAAAVAVGYAVLGTFAPIDVHITGEGPGLNVVGVTLPAGAEGTLYYETAEPGAPYAFGILLIGSTDPNVRIEGLVDEWSAGSEYRGMHWTSVWMDNEPNGGMTGPSRPFAPFDMTPYGQGIWLVGRASSCALGRAPVGDEAVGTIWIPNVKLNVSVYGWPRVVELAMPRIAEPMSGSCAESGVPGSLMPQSSTAP